MLNQCQFIGHLGRDPECRHTQDGKPVINMTLAVSEKWKSKAGEQKESTEWVRVVVWNEKLGEVCQKYLKKGSKIYISGKMKTRSWDKDGVKQYTTEIELGFDGRMIMLDAKPSVEDPMAGSLAAQEPDDAKPGDDLDIPF